MTYTEYISDPKTQSAVERQLGIIGEAFNKSVILKQNNDVEYAHKIIGLRNRLIHAYDSIDSAIVWAILKKHLSPLKEAVVEKLKS